MCCGCRLGQEKGLHEGLPGAGLRSLAATEPERRKLWRWPHLHLEVPGFRLDGRGSESCSFAGCVGSEYSSLQNPPLTCICHVCLGVCYTVIPSDGMGERAGCHRKCILPFLSLMGRLDVCEHRRDPDSEHRDTCLLPLTQARHLDLGMGRD